MCFPLDVYKYCISIFFFNDTATTEIYTLSLHDALPISAGAGCSGSGAARWVMFALPARVRTAADRSSQQIKSAAARTSRRTASTLVENRVASGTDAALFVTASTSAVAPAPNPGAACSMAAAIASISSASRSRSRCALASANARSVEAICSSNSAKAARSVLARSSTARMLVSARSSWALAAPATASRSAAARFSPSTVSAIPNRSASFCRAACFSFSALSKRSTGLSSRLKNAITISPANQDHPPNQAKYVRKIIGNVDNIAAEVDGYFSELCVADARAPKGSACPRLSGLLRRHRCGRTDRGPRCARRRRRRLRRGGSRSAALRSIDGLQIRGERPGRTRTGRVVLLQEQVERQSEAP